MIFLPAQTDHRTIAMLLPVVVFPFAIYFERPTTTIITTTTAITTITIILLLLLLLSLKISIFSARGHLPRHHYVAIGSTITLHVKINIFATDLIYRFDIRTKKCMIIKPSCLYYMEKKIRNARRV